MSDERARPPDRGAPKRETASTGDGLGPLPLDHVGIAVHSIRRAAAAIETLGGVAAEPHTEVVDQQVRIAFVGQVELIEPTAPDTPVGRFLARRGPGLHHLAYQVNDLAAELRRLREAGVRLIDSKPRRGAHGLVAFIHPESAGGVLVELVEKRRP